MLLPYDGIRTFEHGEDGKPRIVREYATDRSGAIEYRFNGLGFRGGEFDPQAPRKIFVCGCSYTFGVGVAEPSCWPARFARLVARSEGLSAADVNLMNFSQGGGSNDYMTRVLLSQSARVKPDLLIAAFTHVSRTEFFVEDRAPTLLQNYVTADLMRKPEFIESVSPAFRSRVQHIKTSAEAYYDFYTPKTGVASALKNMLLIQSWCRDQKIPYLILLMIAEEKLFGGGAYAHPSIRPLADMIDRSRLVPVAEFLDADRAADGSHPGPLAHKRIAFAAFRAYRELYG